MAKKAIKKEKANKQVVKIEALEAEPVKVEKVVEDKPAIGEKNIKNQLDSFIPQIIIMVLGLAAIIVMFVECMYARAFVRGETVFDFYGMLMDLITFDICLGVASVGGVANILIYGVYVKKDKNKIPHQFALATSIVYIVISIVLSVVVFSL